MALMTTNVRDEQINKRFEYNQNYFCNLILIFLGSVLKCSEKISRCEVLSHCFLCEKQNIFFLKKKTKLYNPINRPCWLNEIII